MTVRQKGTPRPGGTYRSAKRVSEHMKAFWKLRRLQRRDRWRQLGLAR